MRIAVFGGSFNPPHIGHVRAAVAAKKALGADRLIVIPTAVSPHKPQPEGSPCAQARLEMTRLAFEGYEGVEVSDMELRRGGRSYTVDTLGELSRTFEGAELILLMGTDMLLSFDRIWRGYDRILALSSLGVFSRDEASDAELERKCGELKEKYGARIELLPIEPVAVSSTEIRGLLKDRKGRELLDPRVYAEIIRLRHYGAKPDLDWLMEQTIPFLDEKRVPHVAGCRQEAVKLALRWGEDPSDAAEAAILHDITKKQKADEQLNLCDKYGIITDNDERNQYKLLHAKTGAELARRMFGSDDRVCSAIFWHTTAHPDMSLLEKIIYIADYIEPTRAFEGVERLRELAYSDLDGALILGLEMSISNLEERGIAPHRYSAEALRQLKADRA